MKKEQSLYRILIPLTLVGAPLVASAENGSIKGTVEVDSERILSGVQVQLADGGRTTTTDRYGNYTFLNVPQGEHKVIFDYLGFEQLSRSVTVMNDETVRLDVSFLDEVIELEPIEVFAQAGSESRALNQQRAADTLMNIVAADAFGKFPDQNAAEALSRVPGIAVDRDQGEGRYVVIRGIDSNLTSFSVDGVGLASPKSDERAVLMDIIPSGVMDALEIYKVTTPDQPGDGIGGYVNVRTPSAFEENTLVARMSVQGNYNDLSGKWGERVEATYGDVYGKDASIGFMATVSYDFRDMASDNQEADTWSKDGRNWATDSLEFREYNLTRTRYGANFNLEYRKGDSALYYLRGNFNRYIDHEYRNRVTFDFGDANLVSADDDLVVWSSDSNHKTKVKNELKDRTEKLSLAGLSLGAEHKLDNLTLDYHVAYSYADEDTPYDCSTTYKLSSKTASYQYDASDDYHPVMSYLSGTDYRDAANYEFDGTEKSSQISEERDLSGQLDVRYDCDTTLPIYVKTGVHARLKNKTNDVETWNYEDIPEHETLDSLLGDFDYPFGSFPFLSHSYSGYFNRNRDSYGSIERSEADSLAEDFESDEDVYAAYLMGGIESGRHDFTAGARVEHTQFSTSGWNIVDDDATHMDASKDYTNVMPGVHYRFKLSDSLIMRASWTNTIARPIFAQSAAASVTEGDEIERGNPDLDPYKSMNFDASVEYYMPHLGMLSAAVFRKNLNDFIYTRAFEETIGGEDYDVTTYLNGDKAHVHGVELAYQQLFTMLPDPWDGFGFLANLTLTDSKARFSPDGEDGRNIEMPRQSDIIGNVALTYSKYGFFVRLAQSYRGRYLDEIADDAADDRFIDNFASLDLSASYEFLQGWTVYGNVINITNEPLRAYFRDSKKLSQYEEYGVTYQLGVRWHY